MPCVKQLKKKRPTFNNCPLGMNKICVVSQKINIEYSALDLKKGFDPMAQNKFDMPECFSNKPSTK